MELLRNYPVEYRKGKFFCSNCGREVGMSAWGLSKSGQTYYQTAQAHNRCEKGLLTKVQ